MFIKHNSDCGYVLSYYVVDIFRQPDKWPQRLTLQAYPKQATVRKTFGRVNVTIYYDTEYDYVTDETQSAAEFSASCDVQLC